MSRVSNKLLICKKILYLGGNIDDILKYIIFFFKADGDSVFLLYLRKPAGDSWGLLADDPQKYFLTPCKNPACY